MATMTSHFRRELLPPARTYYESVIGKLSRPNSKGWALGRCPFHESKSGKSLSVNLNTGAFCCFGCDVRGDMVSFAMRLNHCGFMNAVQKLGAWAERETVCNRELDHQAFLQAVLNASKEESVLRIHYRDLVHTLEHIIRDTNSILQLLKPKDVALDWDYIESLGDDDENPLIANWHIHDIAVGELREAVAAYSLLSFGGAAVREDFVEHPENRDAIVDEILMRGVVRDDTGHVMEISL